MAEAFRPAGHLLLVVLALAAAPFLRANEAGAPKLAASSSAPGHPPAAAMDGKRDSFWESEASGEQQLTIDFGAPRKVGGLAVTWEPEFGASHFIVDASDDGKTWRTLRRIYGASGETSWVRLPAGEPRALRLRLMEGDGPAFGIREIALLPEAVATSPDAFASALASAARRGLFPRALRGEPEAAAPVSSGEGRNGALLSADGAVEPSGGGFSVEPFVRVAGRLLTWADVKAERAVAEGGAPSVTWTSREVGLEVALPREGSGEGGGTVIRYRLRNRTSGRLVATLVLAIRPFRIRGEPDAAGRSTRVAPIRSLTWDGRRVVVNGDRFVSATPAPASFRATSLAGGDVTSFLEAGKVPPDGEAEDTAGFASGALAFPLALEAGGSAEVTLRFPSSPAKP